MMDAVTLKTKCVNIGLPVNQTWIDDLGVLQASFLRSLTPEEWLLFSDLHELFSAAPENRWDIIKRRRNVLLVQSDWTQISDVALSIEEKALWSDYRQALRDLPQTFDNPEDVIFPTAPGGA
jgi:DNA replication initiation complex subunit (GINS family)